MGYRILADTVLVLHAAFVGFVVVGLLLVVIGGIARWRWVRNPWFRAAHLLAIAVVVAQTWLGVRCPLTDLENALRRRAGRAAYEGGFIAHWVHRAIFVDAPPWAFTLAYTLCGSAVVGVWIWVRPRLPRRGGGPPATRQ
jgi:hypothetical protein